MRFTKKDQELLAEAYSDKVNSFSNVGDETVRDIKNGFKVKITYKGTDREPDNFREYIDYELITPDGKSVPLKSIKASREFFDKLVDFYDKFQFVPGEAEMRVIGRGIGRIDSKELEKLMSYMVQNDINTREELL